jgi:hypothetical protein
MEIVMSSPFVVEKDGRTVGIALRCRGGFRFFASEPCLQPLDGRVFPRVRALMQAVHNKGKAQGDRAAVPSASACAVGAASASFRQGATSRAIKGTDPGI